MTLDRRELRALGIVAEGGQIQRVDDTLFTVRSQSGSGRYVVSWEDGRWACGCEDFAITREFCKHLHSIRWTLALPSVVVSNAPIAKGLDRWDTRPFMVFMGRGVPVHDLVEAYRATVEELSTVPGIFLTRPPPPRLRFRRRAPPGSSTGAGP